jgi:hypothetical protein
MRPGEIRFDLTVSDDSEIDDGTSNFINIEDRFYL